ncbi:MAG TPA: hypothetical protein VM009_00955 [Terriglobales bacterium]|nr:hypothetical protein [Terriglobales bacterium]
MRVFLFSTRTISALLVATLSLSTLAQAQSPATQKPLENQGTAQQPVSPGPLQPQPSTQTEPSEQKPLPNAPSSQPNTVVIGPDGKGVAGQPSQQQPTTPGTTQPLGTAAAEKATTAGGAASRPAGTAIAPAKQRQTRSFLIKLGLLTAGGVALGTVYALTKGSPSKPPGAVQ